MPHLSKGYTSKLPSGSSKSNGRRPHLGNTTPLARNSTHGEHRNDHDSNSMKHQGDLSWMPSTSSWALAPEMVLRRSWELGDLAKGMVLIRMRLPLARSWSLLRPLWTFLLPPPQPFFCVRPEGWLLQPHFASPSCQDSRSPEAGCVRTARQGIFAHHQMELGRFQTM